MPEKQREKHTDGSEGQRDGVRENGRERQVVSQLKGLLEWKIIGQAQMREWAKAERARGSKGCWSKWKSKITSLLSI